MPTNYVVAADVVDIRADVPQPTDVFVVDANVWFWMTYTRASMSQRGPRPYQLAAYPQFVQAALTAQATIHRCELTVAELAGLIEKTEFEIFTRSSGLQLKPKEYRHTVPGERQRVVGEIAAAWGSVVSMAWPLPVTVDEAAGNAILRRCCGQPVDGYDAVLLETAQQNSVTQVITDDGDFCTVPGITVFTANASVLSAARASGHLVTR